MPRKIHTRNFRTFKNFVKCRVLFYYYYYFSTTSQFIIYLTVISSTAYELAHLLVMTSVIS